MATRNTVKMVRSGLREDGAKIFVYEVYPEGADPTITLPEGDMTKVSWSITPTGDGDDQYAVVAKLVKGTRILTITTPTIVNSTGTTSGTSGGYQMTVPGGITTAHNGWHVWSDTEADLDHETLLYSNASTVFSINKPLPSALSRGSGTIHALPHYIVEVVML
jgi:hypothetical protein